MTILWSVYSLECWQQMWDVLIFTPVTCQTENINLSIRFVVQRCNDWRELVTMRLSVQSVVRQVSDNDSIVLMARYVVVT